MKDPNPIHDYFPEALVKTFPDCNIIEMHRNPADVCLVFGFSLILSNDSFMKSLHSYFLLESSVAKLLLYGENYDLQKYGQRMVKTFHTRRFRIDRFKVCFSIFRLRGISHSFFRSHFLKQMLIDLWIYDTMISWWTLLKLWRPSTNNLVTDIHQNLNLSMASIDVF